MTARSTPRSASLGELTFNLSPDELRARGLRILAKQRSLLAELVGHGDHDTVAGLLEPLDRILVAVRDVGLHAGLIFQVHPDEATRTAGRELSEAADRFVNELRLNEPLYRKVRKVPVDPSDGETTLAVAKLLRDMRRAGAELDAERRARVLRLSNLLDEVGNEFARNIAAGTRFVEVDGTVGLRGLPPDYIAAHPAGADGKVKISTKYPDSLPAMNYGEDADLRRRVLHEFLNVAHPENDKVLDRLLRHRAELVQLLGYSDFAAYAVEDKMTERPEVVARFLDQLRELLRGPADRDLLRLLARKRRDDPTAATLEDWDGRLWPPGYFATRIRQEEYGVDARALRSYLPYQGVRDGLIALCGELFGLEFRRLPDEDVWHPTVEVYDVTREGGPLGRCYFDFVSRPGKFNHAAQFTVRAGGLSTGLPQGALICNFLDGSTPPDQARMDYRDVITFFHEFGHLLHHLFSGHRRWVYGSMDHLEWDFIEAPSQLFEEWARDPSTLARFARNPDTGEVIPAGLIARLSDAEAVCRAAAMLRQVVLATISFELHRRDPATIRTDQLCDEAYWTNAGLHYSREYHQLDSFGHLVGYSACYYTYLWSAVIARDLLSPFRQRGSLIDPDLARKYVETVLVPGGSRPAAELVRAFLGRDYTFDAFRTWVLAGAVPG